MNINYKVGGIVVLLGLNMLLTQTYARSEKGVEIGCELRQSGSMGSYEVEKWTKVPCMKSLRNKRSAESSKPLIVDTPQYPAGKLQKPE